MANIALAGRQENIHRYNFATPNKMRILIIIVVIIITLAGYFLLSNREGLKWDLGFAGFNPAVSEIITEGTMDIAGEKVDEVAVPPEVVLNIAKGVVKMLREKRGLSCCPIETVFIEMYSSAASMEKVKKERPDVYKAYIKYLESRLELPTVDDEDGEKRAAMVSYLDNLKKNESVAMIPLGVPLTYRVRMILLETKRYYGIQLDAIAMGDEKDMEIKGITTQQYDDESVIKPFKDDLKAGDWLKYDTIANSIAPTKSLLDTVENSVKEKLKR